MNKLLGHSIMQPIYRIIAEDLKNKIYRKTYGPGDKLPTEHEMCSIYQTSRGTLRKALECLTRDQMISQIPGRGTFVKIKTNHHFHKKKAERLKPGNREKEKIAVLVPNISESLYPEIVKGIEDGCHEFGYHCLIGNCDVDPVKEERYMRDFVKSGVSGMIVSPSYNSTDNKYYATLCSSGKPLVLTDIGIPDISANVVCSDNIEGAYLATRRLVRSGCKKIAFVSGWMTTSSSQERFFGFRKALLESGVKQDGELVREGDFSGEFGYRATMDLFCNHKIDAILSANEPISNGIVRAMMDNWKKRSVRKVKLASFDQPAVPDPLKSQTILILQRRYEIGRTALQLLLENINGSRKPIRKVLIEPEIFEYLH